MARTPRTVRFDDHMRLRGRVHTKSVDEIKAWRTAELEAGRPSSFADYCRAHGLCAECNAEGLVLNENGIGFKLVRMEDNMYVFEICTVCDGTGKAGE